MIRGGDKLSRPRVIAALVPQVLIARVEALLGPGVVDVPAGLRDVDGQDGRDDQVDEELYCALWCDVVAKAPHRAIGIEAGGQFPRGTFHALEYLVRSSGTLGEGIDRLLRFHAMLVGEPFFSTAIDGGNLLVVYGSRFEGETFRDAEVDFSLAVLAALLRDVTDGRVLIHAHFARPEPTAPEPYVLFFDSVEWERGHDGILISPEYLAMPTRDADPVLCGILEEVVREQLASAHVAASTASRVRRALTEHLADGPSIEEVASIVGVSVRTLQDRLAEEATSFRDLLDEVRLRLAVQYLKRPELNVSEVAFLVGYSDATAFGRAFKRMTDESPGSYRRRGHQP